MEHRGHYTRSTWQKFEGEGGWMAGSGPRAHNRRRTLGVVGRHGGRFYTHNASNVVLSGVDDRVCGVCARDRRGRSRCAFGNRNSTWRETVTSRERVEVFDNQDSVASQDISHQTRSSYPPTRRAARYSN